MHEESNRGDSVGDSNEFSPFIPQSDCSIISQSKILLSGRYPELRHYLQDLWLKVRELF